MDGVGRGSLGRTALGDLLSPAPQTSHPTKPRPSTSLTSQVSDRSVCPPLGSVALGCWPLLAVRSEGEPVLGLEGV